MFKQMYNYVHLNDRDFSLPQGVRIYGVQVNESAKAKKFFRTMTEITDGQHLKLSEFGTLCDVIMAICYREKGAEFLQVSVQIFHLHNNYSLATVGQVSAFSVYT